LKELTDYSGEVFPEIDFHSFSKDMLIELLRMYGRLYKALDGFWYLSVMERSGNDEALANDFQVWEKLSKYEARHLTRLMKIGGNGPAELIKTLQVCPWFWNGKYRVEMKGKNCAEFIVLDCPTLTALEQEGKGRENQICNEMEPRFMNDYASYFSPNMKVTCLKSPPRKNKDGPCCHWEFKLEEKDRATS